MFKLDCAMYKVTNKITGKQLTVFHRINENLNPTTPTRVVAEIIKTKNNNNFVTPEELKYPNAITRFKNKLLYKIEVTVVNYDQWFS